MKEICPFLIHLFRTNRLLAFFARLILSTRQGGTAKSPPLIIFFLCFCVSGRLFSFWEITGPDAHDLGPYSWFEPSAHIVQDTPTYAAASASLYVVLLTWMLKWRHPIILPRMISSPILVLCVTARECLLLGGNTVTPITSCLRGRCLLFSQLTRHQRTR